MNNDTSIESRSKLTLRDIFNWVIWTPKTLKMVMTKTGDSKEFNQYFRGEQSILTPPLFILFLFTVLHFAVGQLIFDYSAIWSGQKEYLDNLPSDETYTLLENLAFKITRLWILFPALFVPVHAVITIIIFRHLQLNFRTHLRFAAIAPSFWQIFNIVSFLLIFWLQVEIKIEKFAAFNAMWSVALGTGLVVRLDKEFANGNDSPQVWKTTLLIGVISGVVFLGFKLAEPEELLPVFHQR